MATTLLLLGITSRSEASAVARLIVHAIAGPKSGMRYAGRLLPAVNEPSNAHQLIRNSFPQRKAHAAKDVT